MFKRILVTTLLLLWSSLPIVPIVSAQAVPAAGVVGGAAGAVGGPGAAAAGAAGGAAAEAANEQVPKPSGPALDQRTFDENYYNEEQKGVPGILPKCAFLASGCDEENADINLFVELGINIAKFIFAIIGTVAFVMFVYGGFTMILSFGSSEKFKQGKDILVAAVVGMIIAFGAYLIVNFILAALQVGKDFRIV